MKQATPEQETALSDEFRTLLTRTYFSTMLRYRDAKLNVKQEPLLANDGKEATVKSDVVVGNAQQPVLIDYVLYHTEDGWESIQCQCRRCESCYGLPEPVCRRNKQGGLDGLIQSLRNKNAAPTVKAQS